MSGKYYTWASYVMMAMTICLGLFIFFQGGQFFDVGKTISETKKEIINTQLVVQENKQALLRGREERYEAQALYLDELIKQRKKIDEMENMFQTVRGEHDARLKMQQKQLAEIQKLKGKLEDCIRVGAKK